LAALRTVLLIALVLALGACREEEQNREVHFQKGHYAGPAMPKLNGDTRRALRERARHQDY